MIVLVALAMTSACASTPARRIANAQAAFDAYPPEAQAKIEAGQVGLGFDEAMVRMSLGEPDEVSTEIDENGETVTWVYTKTRPGVSLGLGGFGVGGIGLGGGLGVGSGPKTKFVAIVHFREGRVTKARYFDE